MFCPPPTKANQVQSQAWSLSDFRKWESCRRTMPLVGEFSRGSTVSPLPLVLALLHTHITSPSSVLKTPTRNCLRSTSKVKRFRVLPIQRMEFFSETYRGIMDSETTCFHSKVILVGLPVSEIDFPIKGRSGITVTNRFVVREHFAPVRDESRKCLLSSDVRRRLSWHEGNRSFPRVRRDDSTHFSLSPREVDWRFRRQRSR
ncbi:hypothetical protein PR048_026185 [Dryococelus australis]|uniref:Uncharacterized protein n=1 Tax=Dryococelus australis TaxID=614101 RepID=A0ABQ9GKP5_9NEOP|nr:hypothetical protein PR048_026185 [Dryococelus australis]